MRRGGGVCVSGLDDPLNKVSPRIRAIQDRLLDSLPADGAWECLSPPQREAIISIHRSRINRTPDGLCTLPNDAKWKNKKYKEFSQYGRSRSFEDKLESETDDSGVRLASGGTSTSNSQEDDSSDPGIKKSGRFTKSHTADRLVRKDPIHVCDPKKKKTNGIGNVNKILSKQLAKSPNPNKVTLDCRNLAVEKHRYRIDKNNPFEGPPSKNARNDLISRKNILQNHGDQPPSLFVREQKNSISSEEYDSGIISRTDLSNCSFDDQFAYNRFTSNNDAKLHSLAPNTENYRKYPSEFNSLDSPLQYKCINNNGLNGFTKYPSETNNNLRLEEKRGGLECKNKIDLIKKVAQKSRWGSKLNSFDYRNHLNQDNNKYSSNWNNIILSKDVPIKPTTPKAGETRPSRISHGNPTNVSNNRYGDYKHTSHVSCHEKFTGKRYIRSKSLDRKYLDDSSDDDDDFERRRKVERMKRYAKANADWDISRAGENKQFWSLQNDSVGRRSKSAFDLNNPQFTGEHFDEIDNGFRSRKTILSKWKSEDIDLAASPNSMPFCQQSEAFSRHRWQRRSCDVDLDCSDYERKAHKEDIDRRRLHRRSCDAELEREVFNSDISNLNTSNDSDIMHRRNAMQTRLASGYPGKRPHIGRTYGPEIDSIAAKGYKSSHFDPNSRRWHPPIEGKAKPKEYKSNRRGGGGGFRENGVLSFENPNYTLGGSLDTINRNSSVDSTSHFPDVPDNQAQLDGGLSALDSLYTELDHVCNLTRASNIQSRRNYASLDIGSMGVDVTTGPITNLDQADHQNNSLLSNEVTMGRKKNHLNSNAADIIDQVTTREILDNQNITNEDKVINYDDCDKPMLSPEHKIESDSKNSKKILMEIISSQQGSNIPHMRAENSQDLYAIPVKRSPEEALQESEDKDDDALPFGWEKHQDNDGPYFWHIKSGTITRTPPETSVHIPVTSHFDKKNKENEVGVTRSCTSSALSELVEIRPRSTAAVDNAYKRRSFPVRSDFSDGVTTRPIRFAVRSLGWVEIAEEDLTPERSSKAVNRCIVDLSVGGRRDLLDVVGRWGDGKDLFMDLDEGSLKLLDPESLTILNTQPIHTIRVWGVGRDNGRDFAYVARDRTTRKHMCHVFRCDSPARTIANTLRDICKKIMIERSLQQTLLSNPLEQQGPGISGKVPRPTNLPTENRRIHRHSQVIPPQSFPTPMEEPKKIIRAKYIGVVEVNNPTGMEVLNSAIESACQKTTPDNWKNVSVAVAPSTITITNIDDGRQLAECRVRFLSFLGIGQDVKLCSFIMHTAQDQFIAHVFQCEPSSGALCKTVEAACKLRYQKCLDAHPGGSSMAGGGTTPKTISATIKSMFTTFTNRKSRSTES